MPLTEALERAGSFEALRPYLRDGRIRARHSGMYYWPEGGALFAPGEVDPGLWTKAYFEPEIEQVIFATIKVPLYGGPERTRHVVAINLELGRSAVDALFSIATASAPSKPLGRKRGPKPYDLWPKLYDYLERETLRTGKKFSSFLSAAQTGIEWLTKEGLPVPTEDTVRKKIQRERPDLVDAIE